MEERPESVVYDLHEWNGGHSEEESHQSANVGHEVDRSEQLPPLVLGHSGGLEEHVHPGEKTIVIFSVRFYSGRLN